MRLFALTALLCLAPAIAAQDAPSIKLPADVKVPAGKFGELKADTAGKNVKWVALTPGLDLRSCDGGKTLLFTGAPGTYELLAYTAAGDVPSDPARCVVVIGSPEPLPPKPDTRLRDKYAEALKLDQGEKPVLQLAFVYEEAARVAGDATVTTTKELLARVRDVTTGLLGADALFNLRVAVSEELLAVIGMTSDEPITDAQRKRAAELWRQTAAILKELVPK